MVLSQLPNGGIFEERLTILCLEGNTLETDIFFISISFYSPKTISTHFFFFEKFNYHIFLIKKTT